MVLKKTWQGGDDDRGDEDDGDVRLGDDDVPDLDDPLEEAGDGEGGGAPDHAGGLGEDAPEDDGADDGEDGGRHVAQGIEDAGCHEHAEEEHGGDGGDDGDRGRGAHADDELPGKDVGAEHDELVVAEVEQAGRVEDDGVLD